MRRIAFLIAFLGLGILLILLLNKPLEINSLEKIQIGTNVKIQGMVEEERNFGSGKLLIINEIPIYCECFNIYAESTVYVEGIVEKFPEDLRIKAFRITKISD